MVAGTALLAPIAPGMQIALAVAVFPKQIAAVSHSTVLVLLHIKAWRVSGQDPPKYYSAKSGSVDGSSF